MSQSRVSDEELLAELRAGAAAIGRPPTWEDIDAFGEYSCQPYRDRWGTIINALEAAGLEVPESRKESGRGRRKVGEL